MIKLSDYVVQFIASRGVKHVFMLPGGGAMHLDDSLGRCKDIQFVCNLHEQACAVAAEAYARITNNIGVALVTSGPGGTNTITGVAGAWQDSTPCLFISGQVKRADMIGDSGVRQVGLQEIDIIPIVSSITKYAVTVLDPTCIRYHLEKAEYLATSGRPGPAWVDIPLDVQAAMIEPDDLRGFEPAPLDPPRIQDEVARAIELLNEADRPVLLAGNGIRLAGAQADFLNMVDQLGIPVQTSRLGVDLIPHSHKLCFGSPGHIAPRGANFTIQNADWVLILGARLDTFLTAYAPDRLARAATKVVVDIDPSEIRRLGKIASVPICADLRLFFREFFRLLPKVKPKDRSAWLGRCRDWKARYPFVLPEHFNGGKYLSMYAFSAVLSDELASDDIVLSGSSGVAADIFSTALEVKAGQRVFFNKGTSAMGLAQPAAIGACLAGGGRRVVCVDGDGGFQLNIQELETVRRLGLPIKFFVINNQGYAMIRQSQGTHFKRLTGADASSGLTLPDVTEVAAAYGLDTARISSVGDLKEQVRRVLDRPEPIVCEVIVDPDEVRAPRVSTVVRPDGSIVSKPLEDMWPFLDRDEFRANMIIPPLEE